MRIRIFSLASGLHAEAMSRTAEDPFVREVIGALRTAAGTSDGGESGVDGGVAAGVSGVGEFVADGASAGIGQFVADGGVAKLAADGTVCSFGSAGVIEPVTDGADCTSGTSGVEVLVCGELDASFGSGDADLLYIRTGGTEGAFKARFTDAEGHLQLPSGPVLLLTSGKSNSLAASMEILSFLRLQGHPGEILHGSPTYIAGRILSLASCPPASAPTSHKNADNVSAATVSAAGGHKNYENVSAVADFAAAGHKNDENVSTAAASAAAGYKSCENVSAAAASVAGGHKIDENVAADFGGGTALGRRPFDAAAWKLRLQGKRVGILGKPSDWLISSDVDPETAREELGLELVEVPMDEVVAEIRRGGYEMPQGIRTSDAAHQAQGIRTPNDGQLNQDLRTSDDDHSAKGFHTSDDGRHAQGFRWPGDEPITEAIQPRYGRRITPEAFEGAMDIYGALCRLVARYRLDALTLRCFDLLTEVGNTGCMALALLNAQGIPSSCEGDVPALISMMVARELTGCCGFQANPSRIDPQTGEMLLAHCTVPLNMIRRGEYDTHFESGIGVAVRGELEEGPVTLFKLSPDLRQCFAADASLLTNLAERDLCRTQVVLRAPGTARYFLTDSIGNHHIVIPGHHAVELVG